MKKGDLYLDMNCLCNLWISVRELKPFTHQPIKQYKTTRGATDEEIPEKEYIVFFKKILVLKLITYGLLVY